MTKSRNVFRTKLADKNPQLSQRITGMFILALCLSALQVFAAQEQPYPPQESQSQEYQSNDGFRPFGPAGDPQAQPPQYQQVPPTLTLPAGTVISVRTSQFLSSDQNHPGDIFDAVLQQPVIVNGLVVARKGQTVLGRVAVAQKARHGEDQSRLGVELTHLVLVDGQQLPLQTQLMQASGGTSTGRDLATLGMTTGTGAMIGAAVNRREPGEGAGIGAAIGAAAGIIGVLLSPGKPTVIPPEAQLTFQTQTPVTISTEHSQQAFRPITAQDFPSQNYDYYRDAQRYGPRSVVVAPAYPPPPYSFDFYYGRSYYRPYFGPRVVIRPRFAVRGSGRFRR